MKNMDILQLKTSLIKMGVPIFKNNKICKKDLKDMRFKESGLEVLETRLLDHQDEPNKMICTWHLKIGRGNAKRIEEVFYQNKEDVEKKLLCYCHKMGFGAVSGVELEIKNKNNENIWLQITHHFNLKAAYEREEGCLDPFFHRLFERG